MQKWWRALLIVTLYFTHSMAQAGLIYGDATERTFDGTHSYSAGYDPIYSQQTPFSIAATFTATASPNDWVRVVGRGSMSNRNYGLWYNQLESNFLFQAYGFDGFNVYFQAALQLDKEYSMVGVLDGNTARLYLNGTEVASRSPAGTSLHTDFEPLTIGGASFHAIHQGSISNVGLWDHALTSEEISQYSTDGITEVSEPPIFSMLSLALFGMVFFRKHK